MSKHVHAEAISLPVISCLVGKIAVGQRIIADVTDLVSCLNVSTSAVSALSGDDQAAVRAVFSSKNADEAKVHIEKIGDGHIRDALKNLIGLFGDFSSVIPQLISIWNLLKPLFPAAPTV